MTISVSEARDALRLLVETGFDVDYAPPSMLGFNSAKPVRHSAVLILFGALDRRESAADHSIVPPELDVLLMRRSDTLRHHAGQISFPGGGAEPGDAGPVETALREAEEETGLDPAGVEILGMLPKMEIPVSNNLVTPVVGWWTHPTPVSADHSESVEVFRAPVSEMLHPNNRWTSLVSRGSDSFRGAAFELRPQGHIVWGFTGILLANLYDKLGWTVPWDTTREFPVVP